MTTEQELQMVVNFGKTQNIPTINGYYGPRDFILKHGKRWEVSNLLIEPLTIMTMGQCYNNCSSIAVVYEEFVFVDGYARIYDDEGQSLPFAFEHAWLMDAVTGKIYDPTWGTRGFDYLGVPIQTGYLFRNCIMKSHDWPVIANFMTWREKYHPMQMNGSELRKKFIYTALDETLKCKDQNNEDKENTRRHLDCRDKNKVRRQKHHPARSKGRGRSKGVGQAG